MKILECREISLNRNGPVLKNISVTFRSGEISLITGRTGAGKSSFLYLLGGLIRPSAGRVIADGKPVSRWTSIHKDRWRRRIGIVFQNIHLLPDLTVLENVMLPLIPGGHGLKQIRARALDVLKKTDIAHQFETRVADLSGGEKQWVALARALVLKPALLLIDEPTAHQDDGRVNKMLNIISRYRDLGCVIIMASHDPRVRTAPFADNLYLLEEGTLTPRL
jgi:putative ABC transport system ATP-binding protein